MQTSSLSLDIETLVELTPEDAQQVNGGFQVQPTPTAVSSARPPQPTPPVHKKHRHHHQTVSSVMPTPPVHI